MIDKKDVIRVLEEFSTLLELMGENPFKVRAFGNAARALQGMPDDIHTLVETGEITSIKGIGKSLAEIITELVKTGKSVEFEELKAQIPAGVTEMLKIPGFGPKKAKAVWDRLGITTVRELEYACNENRLVDLEGFGKKTQEKILKGIDLLKRYSDRHLLSEARLAAEALYEQLKSQPGVIRIEIAGSLRRWRETIKDVDILISAADENHEALMTFFTSLPEVETITGKGSTKSSVVLRSGINADLRIVSDEQFPYALHHFTGSKEHNISMREFARKKDLKMNEYGLFRHESELVPCRTETDIFRELGMSYIPPELRENYGEMEAALENRIPKLIEQKDIRGVLHIHSHYSDGANTIEEMAEAARQRGYAYLLICDHSKNAVYANGLTADRIEKQHAEIDELNKKWKDFRVLKGIECDILADGELDFTDDILARFEAVVVSVHSKFKMTEEEGTARILKAIRNPYTTILGHPTGRLLLGREGYPVNMNRVIEVAAEEGVSIELNANPHRLDIDWRLLRQAKEKGVKISINPDSHQTGGIDDIRYGVGIARKGWLEKSDVLNTISADELLAFARKRHR